MLDAITVLGMGFGQDQRPTGQEELSDKLQAEFGSCRCWYGVWPVQWDHDARGLAYRIHRRLAPGGRVVLGMYSWSSRLGTDLAEYLGAYQRRVLAAVFCSPVYRSKAPGVRFLVWASRRQRIMLPANVDYAMSFRASGGVVRDHPVVRKDDGLVPERWLPLPHGDMDEAPEYHKEVLDWTRRAIGMTAKAVALAASLFLTAGCGGDRMRAAAGFGAVVIGGTAWGTPSMSATLGDHQGGKPGLVVAGPDSAAVTELVREFLARYYPTNTKQ